MREVAIVSPCRTPVGSFGGTLREVPAQELASLVVKEVVSRSGIDPEAVEDVVLGHGYPSGENPAIGRLSALKAGLPIEVPGQQVDRRCSSGLQAIVTGAMMVQTGSADAVIAGGVESMSSAEYYVTGARWGGRLGSLTLHDRLVRSRSSTSPEERFGPISGMIETAENLARQYEIAREEQDEYALRSHQRAARARESGRFDREIVTVEVPQRKGEPVRFQRDEGPREDTSLEKLARLKPVFPDGTVSPGNASSQNDAAAACLLVARDRLYGLGLEPAGYFRAWAAAGVHPAYMGIGPVPAVRKVFEKTGLSFSDMGLVELNEAFAAQVLAVLREWRIPEDDLLNVNGSGISLGHPIGATGARIMVTLLHEMQRREVRYGLETMCVGGGQGMAAIFERA